MLIRCKIIRIVHKNEVYQILGCLPTGDNADNDNKDIVLNQYNNFTIRDNMLMLNEGKEYELEIEEVDSKYGKTYLLKSIPSLQIEDIKSITEEMEYNILCEITTTSLADEINQTYPNYVRLILQGQESEIDLKKIKGVKKVRHNLFCRLINERFKYYYILEKHKEYGLEIRDCKELCSLYTTVEKVSDVLQKIPYYALINVCGRPFIKIDDILKKIRPDLLDSDQRTEFLMIDVLEKNQYEGSTYMNANDMAEYCNGIDSNLTPKLKAVATNSNLIYYDDDSKNIAIMKTYMAECNIAEFIKDKIKNSIKLDWDWSKFTEIKDGILTDEQSNTLKTFCENSFSILDAPSGTGKTSVMKAILDMCDKYSYSYCCLAFTGKASARMAEQTGRPSSTIHRKTLSGKIVKDVIIIDEYSMLSIDLLNMVISAIDNPDTRIFLVGDSCQIPSLGMGKISKDLLETDYIPKCTLTYCFRFDEGGSSYVSTLTRQGKFYLTDEQCQQDRITLGKKKDYTFIKSNNTVDQIVDEYMKLINKGISKEDICILTPFNQYEFGATIINNLVQAEINPPKPKENYMKTAHNKTDIALRKNDLIMNIKNDYNALSLESYNMMLDEWGDDSGITSADVPKISIFNGQIGKVLSVDNKILTAKIDEDIIVFDKMKCYNLLLSYATNPFKFQGSSCKYIINLIVPQHKKMLNRQLLYTAQTRQEISLIEIGDINTIKDAINQLGDDNRKTMLKDLLKNK